MVAPMMQQPPWQMRQYQQPPGYMQWQQSTAAAPDLWQQAQSGGATPWQVATAGWQQPTAAQVANAPQSPRTTPMVGTLPDTWEMGNFQPQWDYQKAQTETTSNLTGGPPPTTPGGLDQGYARTGQANGQTAPQGGAGGQMTPYGFQVNTPNGYGKPNAYYYNGHATEGDKGQWIVLPVQYNEAADTRRWEYNGTPQESTMRRAIRYAYDDVRDGRSQDFNQALMARLTQFYNEAGGQGVGYTLNGAAPGGGTPGGGAGGGGTAPGTGGGTTRSFGQFNTNDLAFALQQARQDPDAAAILLRMAQGQTGRPLGRLAGDRSDMYGKAFQTALNLAGMDGMGTLEGMAGDFLNNAVLGNNLLGYGSQLGRKVAGMNWDGVDSATMEQAIRAGLALQGLNMGSLGGAVQSGRLNDILYADLERGLRDTGYDQRNFSDLLANSPFARVMANYGR